MKPNPYKVRIGNQIADPYRIERAYGGFPAPIFQAIKKLLRFGQKHKTREKDVEEAISSLKRWQEMEAEDKQAARKPASALDSRGK